jgi:Flp pilus assembly protein TadD
VDAEDFAGAVKELELAVQHAPNNAPARLDLGNAYRGNRQFELAQREYERALQLDHKLADAYFNLGVLHLDGDKPGLPATERLEKAIAYFDRYAASGSTDPKLGQHRRDAALLLDKEKKRQAREEKDRLRKEAEAKKKKEEGRKAESAAREAEEAKGRAPAVPVPKPTQGPAPAPGGTGERK